MADQKHDGPPATTETIASDDRLRDVVIVGAGLAGASAAFHLTQAGADVLVLEKDEPSSGASGIGYGMVNPMMARKARPVWEVRNALHVLDLMGPPLQTSKGLWRPAGSVDQATLFQKAAEEHPDVGRWHDPETTERALPWLPAPWGALEVIEGRSLHIPSVVTHWTRGIELQSNRAIASWDEHDGIVTARCQNGQLFRTRKLLLCMGTALTTHPETSDLNLHVIKGQVARFKKPSGLPTILPPVSGHGYLVDAGDGSCWVGSTFEHTWTEEGPTAAGTEELRSKAANLASGFEQAELLDMKVGFRVTVPGSRKPMLGPISKKGNVWVFSGLGAKGLLFSAYLGSQIPTLFNKPEAIPEAFRVVRRSANP